MGEGMRNGRQAGERENESGRKRRREDFRFSMNPLSSSPKTIVP
jgi:hypothetical protein